MPCGLSPDKCRRDCIAARLDDARPDGADFEARCPACGHGGFRISRPTRSRSLRNIWTCSCKRCKCSPGAIRAELLKRDILPGCLGSYDGNAPKDIDQEAARRMNLTISDILAVPHLRPADMRLALAEAQGQEIPGEYGPFVKFAKSIGIGHQQAYEAARRWLGRPSDLSPPQTGGGVVDTSHNTEPGTDVKPRRPGSRKPTETVELPYGNRTEDRGTIPTETVERTANDKPVKPAA